jgi:apolipoprotein N-acyltransferase
MQLHGFWHAKSTCEAHSRGSVDPAVVYLPLSAVAYWISLPPLNVACAVIIVPMLWSAVICYSRPSARNSLSGALDHQSRRKEIRSYLIAWASGIGFWAAAFAPMAKLDDPWLRELWLILSITLGLIWPVFIWLSRFAYWRLGWPVWLAAPVVWCGLEACRKQRSLVEFPFASLEHALYRQPMLLQGADIVGEYGIGFAIVMVGAGLGDLVFGGDRDRDRHSRLPHGASGAVVALAILGGAVIYGQRQLAILPNSEERDSYSIAALQGSLDSAPSDRQEQWTERQIQYRQLSADAGPHADVVIWPEDSCELPYFEFSPDYTPSTWRHESRASIDKMLSELVSSAESSLCAIAKETAAPVILGLRTTFTDAAGRRSLRNAALMVDVGCVAGPRQDKRLLAPVIERGWLARRLFPTDPPWEAGKSTVCFSIAANSAKTHDALLPNAALEERLPSRPLRGLALICYESGQADFVRSQVIQMRRRGEAPDVFLGLSNDVSWRLESLSEMHTATYVYRAVENRKPYVSAVSGGYASWIDNAGRIRAQGEPGEPMYIVATVTQGDRTTPFQRFGHWLPDICLLADLSLLLWTSCLWLRARRSLGAE